MSHRDDSTPGDAARRGEAAMDMAAYQAAAFAEADAHFDDRALEAQRHKILARLAHLGQPAKVIKFPKGHLGEVQAPRVNRRWISVAAAAGLLLGILGGELMHLLPKSQQAPVTSSSIAPAAQGLGYVSISAPADDGLLGEIELVMQARTANELRALDEFTLADQH
ncbi:MAG TPA: hypothetical protein VNT81_00360 [Vicinamibacterales bacterium]|nr:hypothetical protein [Vicinamibacterales bacterium]